MAWCEQQAKVLLEAPVEIVVTSNAGYPLDLTFYQSIKGLTAAASILKPGGTIIIAQENAEGVGSTEFAQLLEEVTDPHRFIQEALQTGANRIDQWALHHLEKVLRNHTIYNYSTGIPLEIQRKLFVEPVGSVEEGLERALAEQGPEASIAVLPDGPYVLPCLRGEPLGQMNVHEMAAANQSPPVS
jgi:nickel-dependent lactate racemase